MIVDGFEEVMSGNLWRAQNDIQELQKKVMELEYLVYKLTTKHPGIKEMSCDGCKYITEAKSYGVGHDGELHKACSLQFKASKGMAKGAYPNGCYYWRLKDETTIQD